MASDPQPAARAGNAAGEPAGPIFVLAAPCSEAAMVGAMLGRHPGAFALPELNLFTSDTVEGLWSDFSDREQVRMHGLLRTIAQLFGGEQSIAGIAMARRWLFRRLYWPTGHLFAEIAGKVAPARPVEKSRSNVRDSRALERLRMAVPDAAFLHVVRHPRSQGAAFAASEPRPVLPLQPADAEAATRPDPEQAWLDAETRIASFLADIPADRQVLLRVEDLHRSPAPTLRRLCRKLRLDDGPPAIVDMLTPEASCFAGYGPFGAHLGDDPTFLNDPTFRKSRTPMPSLEGGLEWQPERRGFAPEVVSRAQALGYS